MEATKGDLDSLYHLLRKVCLSDEETGEAVVHLCHHLCCGSSYPDLDEWLKYYGGRYILPHVLDTVTNYHVKFNRVVELGAGTGWLGSGLAEAFKTDLVLVDKRYKLPQRWSRPTGPRLASESVCLDLEDCTQLETLTTTVLQCGDLLVMCEFLHCLDEPEAVVAPLIHYPWVVIEYNAADPILGRSYIGQLAKYGATACPDLFKNMVIGRSRKPIPNIHPYVGWVLGTKE